MNQSHKKSPWKWVPTLYFAQGLPYVAVMTIAVVMYKNLGMSNSDIAFYTGWLYLPWVIKPLWSPFVDLIKTKRFWIIAMQFLVAAGFAGVAFFIPTTFYIKATLAFFWLLAFSSATHDIAADGFVLTGAGWGHGVGLCQIGAAVMGAKGYTYDQILKHYFRGATLNAAY